MFAVALLLAATPAYASGPQLPCGAPIAYPAPDAAPAIATWQEKDLVQWHPPACTGWPAESRSKMAVTLAGSFRFDGPMSVLLARIGAVSALHSIQYWSTTDKRWGPLSRDASALTGPDPKSRRRDFAATEMGKGAELYSWEDDVRTGPAVYRLRVLESDPERAVIATENVTPLRRYFLTLFKPGALQSVLIVQRLSPGVYGAFILNRSGEGTSLLAAGHEKSYVNRSAALYRQLAGIRTDREPPAAP